MQRKVKKTVSFADEVQARMEKENKKTALLQRLKIVKLKHVVTEKEADKKRQEALDIPTGVTPQELAFREYREKLDHSLTISERIERERIASEIIAKKSIEAKADSRQQLIEAKTVAASPAVSERTTYKPFPAHHHIRLYLVPSSSLGHVVSTQQNNHVSRIAPLTVVDDKEMRLKAGYNNRC